MKKSISILLLISLVLSLFLGTSALSEGSVSFTAEKEVVFQPSTLAKDIIKVENTSGEEVSFSVEVYDQASKQVVENSNYSIPAGSAPMYISGRVYKNLEKIGNINTYRITVITSQGKTHRLYFAQKYLKDDPTDGPVYIQYHNVFFNNNTVSSFGISFQDAGIKTDLWYKFTPVDLAVQGRQTYKIIAGNMYEIGEMYVDVNDDTVVISYHVYYDGKGGNTETKREYLNVFKSLADVVVPNDVPRTSFVDPETKFAFNVPFSIQYDLDGDTKVLISMRNVVDYWIFPRPSNAQYIRHWPNLDENKALRNSMQAILDASAEAPAK